MTIPEAREKCKNFLARIPRDVLCLLILVLASLLSFGLGFFAGRDASADANVVLELSSSQVSPGGGESQEQVVASQSGARYYFPECPGANRISEANKITFVSAAAAEAAGYTRAANCRP